MKDRDTKYAVDQGADEIDMVISRGKFHQGEYNFVFDEIAAIKEACGNARLKVILETGNWLPTIKCAAQVISRCTQVRISSKRPPENFTRRHIAGNPGDAGSDP